MITCPCGRLQESSKRGELPDRSQMVSGPSQGISAAYHLRGGPAIHFNEGQLKKEWPCLGILRGTNKSLPDSVDQRPLIRRTGESH